MSNEKLPHPLAEFAGSMKNDPMFAEWVAEMKAYRKKRERELDEQYPDTETTTDETSDTAPTTPNLKRSHKKRAWTEAEWEAAREKFSEELSKVWPEGLSAVDAIAEQRR